MSIDGNTIVIGADRDDDNGSSSGSAYVFSNDSGTWTQTAKLTAYDGAGGDYFGGSVSIDGNTIVIGADRDDDRGSSSGSAYVFSNDSGTWTQTAKLTASDGASFDYFGDSVSIDGNTIVIGADRDDDRGSSSGSAYVFTNDSGTWTQTAKLTASDGASFDYFGGSVSIDGSTIVVGTLLNSLSLHRDKEGSAYIYRAPQATLLQRADADGNGIIGIPDFLAFVEVFGTADARFDFDDDGTVGIPDFLIFVNDLFGQSVS